MITPSDLRSTPARILIVDDDRANRELLKVFLRPEGYVLMSASNGVEALAAMTEQQPDLVLLDVMLPGLDGYQVAARIKANPATTNIPIVMVTALDDRNAMMLGLSAGAEDFLSKPVDCAELCVRVRNLLRLKAHGDFNDKHRQKLERDVASRTADLRRERDSAQRYLDTAQVILLALDPDGRITMVNRYACTVLGWTADELIGREWIDTCVVPRARDQTRAQLADLLRSGARTSDNRIITRSGEERLIEWRDTVVRDDFGRIIGTLSSGADITERHQAVQALQTAEERMRFALENANVGIWDMDYAADVVRWSEILERQHGVEPGTFGGTFAAFIERIHRDDRESVRDVMMKAAKSGDDFSLEYRALAADGSVRRLSGAGRFQLGDHREPIRGVGISQDFTERYLLEAQYRQSQKMDAVGQLASGVAHDFNNLLAVILGFAELMRSDVDTKSSHGAELAEIVTAGRRAAALTKHLLAFSRQQVLQPAPLDVNALVTEMSALFGIFTGSGITVTLDLAQTLSPAIADRGQFEQVVMNLVINARDAMPDGGTLTIETTDVDLESSGLHDEVIVKGEYVMLAITDTGSGMTKEIQRHLFEPFFTTKENGSGTGLGLSTAYGIVKQSKGYIWVKSEPGLGTTFTVYLPRSIRTRVTPTFGVAALAPTPRICETLLLVEDEASIRKLAKRILDRAGYRVLEAANGEEAEHSFAEHAGSIDLVVTDMIMPGCSGPELLNRLWARAPALKALLMSGHNAQPAWTGKNTPRDLPFVQKPFTAAELERQVRYALDR
jgi:two-component system, cell cycle sensor histidine kinase and response regulator CckA